MQDKDTWHFLKKRYGFKRFPKQIFKFKSKRVGSPFEFYFGAIVFMVFGIMVYSEFKQHAEERRLKNPSSTNVKFVEAVCYGQSGKSSPHMFIRYTYSLLQSDGREQTYEIGDSKSYITLPACEADLQNASSVLKRTSVLYDQDKPTNANWTLDQKSPAPFLWFTSIISGLLFIIGVFSHRKKIISNDKERRNG